ncbi:MAG: cation:proton antiporter [Chloroflexi bacterium]|nr:cation:proton antiporter [Chloroflexota bacterium]
MDFALLAVSLVSFLFIVLSAHRIGQLATHLHLPLITGYLVAGILAGPFIFHFVGRADIESLRFLDETALAFIAFAAGSEMALDELRGRFRSIGWNTLMQIASIYVICGVAILLLADHIPFMRDLSPAGRIAVALLSGPILSARSPSSAIAIINEMRARGPFTKTVLGVTVVKDVLIVVLFALSTSISASLLTGRSFDLTFIVLVLFELLASIGLGLIAGRVLGFILGTHWEDRLKLPVLLLIGYAVFALSHELQYWSQANMPAELHFEPLLICLVASFWLTNRSPYRSEFRHLLHEARTPIFVVFFTLVGASLNLGIVATLLPITLALYIIRIVALFIGAYLGGTAAGDPSNFKRIAWMGYITQAGVAIGLSKEVAIAFPDLGVEFTTLLVAVIVVSELTGPIFFKTAIRLVGESHLPKDIKDDEILDVVIVGIENQSRQLAERLLEHGWRVKLLDTDKTHVSSAGDNGHRKEQWLPQISAQSLTQIIEPKTEVAVALLPNDENSLKLCRILYEDFGITRQIARLHDYTLVDEFRELGVHVLHPANAMVHLLDHFVRAPQLVTMVFEDDPEHDVIQVTITDPNVDGLHLRELILPDDVLVMAIGRRGHSIVPHGYTNLHLEDELTLIGPTDSLEEVALKLGY